MSIGNIILIIAAAIAGLIIVGGATYFLIFRMFFKSFGKMSKKLLEEFDKEDF